MKNDKTALPIVVMSKFVNHAVPGDVYDSIEFDSGASRRDIKRMFNALRLAGIVEKTSPHNSRAASFRLSEAGVTFYGAALKALENW